MAKKTSERGVAGAGPIKQSGEGGATPDVTNPAKTGSAVGLNVANVALSQVQTRPNLDQPQLSPIGVPPTYMSPATGGDYSNILDFSNRTVGAPPRAPIYFEGADNSPAGYPPEMRQKIKKDLLDAGLLDPPYDPNPTWDAQTRIAYRNALALANAAGKTYDEIIKELKDNTAKYGRARAQRQALVITRTNPTDIANIANQVAVRTVGHSLSDEQLGFLTSSYNAMEDQYQKQQYELAGTSAEPGPGGAIYGPPNVSSYAEEQVRKLDPAGASEMTGLHNYAAFQDLLSAAHSRLSTLANPVHG